MPAIRTEITELATGLGMLGFESLSKALEQEPEEFLNVTPSHWERLRNALEAGLHGTEYEGAWANGRAFLESSDGLRGRRPIRIEWKGPHNPPGYDFLPADLRVDHVFLISCKYLSRLLANPSPSHLFEHALTCRTRSGVDWYEVVAPAAYQRFYSAVRAELTEIHDLPDALTSLKREQRDAISAACARKWTAPLQQEYAQFAAEVSHASAERWRAAIERTEGPEGMLWRLLRLNSAPYFVLGTAGREHLRVRVGTPWDWRQRYRLERLIIDAPPAGQPRVNWQAVVIDITLRDKLVVGGHVEIRWSHGRFCGFPEAKLYLDTPHSQVPGYFPLV